MSMAPAAPPSGTVTFLFTDIEGSTQRWDHDPAAMQSAVRLHDELVRAAIESHGGFVFKTVGDAFYAAFQLAPHAAFAAIAIQRALGEADFRAVGGLAVRVALHTGDADERGGDYFGPPLNRVARLLSIGHGGQTLLSAVTAGLVEPHLRPAGAELVHLGVHRLKDLERPEHVHQLNVADGRFEFPALRSLDALPNNLPAQLTSFIERDHDIAEISGLLESHRVVTLVGSGGVGKTRISLQVGADRIERNEDGVWFVELAALTDPTLIPAAITSAMGLRPSFDADRVAGLIELLKSRRILLILDNCEHVLRDVATIASAIARACPRVTILASSRQPLGIAAEATYRIPSLLVPSVSLGRTIKAAQIADFGALALFVARAKAADSRFEVTDENAPVIAAICRRLDGIALAIELAAPRVKIMRLADLRDRLTERFRVLTGGSRDLLERQQTLRATIDWSFDLLEPAERAFLCRLGVFADTFTLEAAVNVCATPAMDEFAVLELLTSLVDKSLVLSDIEGQATRYRMLETTRAYAREKLHESSEFEAIAHRHFDYMRDLFLEVAARIERDGRQARKRLDDELENARAAMDFSLRCARVRDGAIILAITDLWEGRELFAELVERAELFLDRVPEDDHWVRGMLFHEMGWSLLQHGHLDRYVAASTRALDHARLANNDALHVRALARRVNALLWVEKDTSTAEACLDEAEPLTGSSATLRMWVLRARAELYAAQQRWHELQEQDRELLNIARQQSEVIVERWLLWHIAFAECQLGNAVEAAEMCRSLLLNTQGVAFTRDLRSSVAECLVLALLLTGDVLEAISVCRATLIRMSLIRDQSNIFTAPTRIIGFTADALARLDRWEHVGVLAGYSQANAVYGERFLVHPAQHERFWALVRGHYAPAELERDMARGALLNRAEASELALEAMGTWGAWSQDTAPEWARGGSA
jgi:predicted ATPase/class 3 adenylate cyclase